MTRNPNTPGATTNSPLARTWCSLRPGIGAVFSIAFLSVFDPSGLGTRRWQSGRKAGEAGERVHRSAFGNQLINPSVGVGMPQRHSTDDDLVGGNAE